MNDLPMWIVASAAVVGIVLAGCTSARFESHDPATGRTVSGSFSRLWTDTALSVSPETGLSYSSNPDAAQQQQILDALRAVLLLRGLPAPAAPLPAPAPPRADDPPPIQAPPAWRPPANDMPPFEDEEPYRPSLLLPPMLEAEEPRPVLAMVSTLSPTKSPLRLELERIKRQLAAL